MRLRQAGSQRLREKIIPLVGAEVISRISNFIVVVVISRALGVEALGIFAFAQTLSNFVKTGCDLGLKTIGVRLLVQGEMVRQVVKRVQEKRVLLGTVIIPVTVFVVFQGPVPEESRVIAAMMVFGVLFYLLTTEWVFWAKERYWVLGCWRAILPLCVLVPVGVGLIVFGDVTLELVAVSYGVSYLVGLVFLKLVSSKETSEMAVDGGECVTLGKEVGWKNALVLGGALLFSQLFHYVDAVMLGIMVGAEELGFYNASYRLIFLLFGFYYLLTQVMFPSLVRGGVEDWLKVVKASVIIAVFGILLALCGSSASETILTLVYGEEFFPATSILQILFICVPFEFVGALLGTVVIAWGLARASLIVMVISFLVNVVLNLFLIPKFGALGSAWATILSYLFMVPALFGVVFWKVYAR